MKELILMRHAKSSWGTPGLDDHDRPLNGRGRRAATALGHWMRDEDLAPDQILCSTSIRTRETCDRLGLALAPDLQDSLYLAEPAEMLGVLRKARGNRILMIGHNPGICDFARTLVATPPAHDRFADYPTGATLVARFDIDDWSDLVPGTGTVRSFVTPHDLG
ncbi:SixA phosphatase family protein [Roseovarius tibetensis]|uniref:SixA phosphatase family protein n=1 Tax=Roseovarius tibetensis TaxID=2685897 RepID=UPI003D800137